MDQTAISDQAGAAAREAARDLRQRMLRAYPGEELLEMEMPRGGTDEAVVRAFREWLAGEPVECPHDPISGERMFWVPYAPGLMCAACMTALSLQAKAGPEDRTCDICRREVGEKERWDVRNIIVKGGWGPETRRMLPPVVILYAACEGCMR